ncbi:MAG: stage sporulation protein [Bacillales bacterium]|jgi:stage II sporulation protein P|nr:stage sporulation protein [Bacillales bacterium]
MRSKAFGAIIALVSTKKFTRIFVSFILINFLTFSVVSTLTALKPKYRLSSSYINEFLNQYNGKIFLFLLGQESQYFNYSIKTDMKNLVLSKLLVELGTSINISDPRSLLGNEIPGFRLFDTQLIVAEKDTNYSNVFIETSPPLDFLSNDTVVDEEKIPVPTSPKPITPPTRTTNGRNVIYIYHTHTRESFLPLLKGTTDANKSFNSKANITLVGANLAKELEQRGIGSLLDKTDFTGILLQSKQTYAKSYDVSRKNVAQSLKNNKDLRFIFDLHRDAAPKKNTTSTIKGKNYARITFVVGGEYQNYEKNLKFATDLHYMLNNKYPGISRSVVLKKGVGVNGKYNQDLSSNALTVEFGGIHNDLNELYNTTEVFAEVFTDYYWKNSK